MAYHGYPRYTKDLDIWVWLDPENAEKVTEALDFETCFANREIVRSGDISVNFLDFEHLVASKIAAGRPQDRVDVKKLRKRKTKNK